MTSVQMLCRCGSLYSARQADLNRGWGKSCSKSCAALRRDFGGKAAKRLDGLPLHNPRKKGAIRISIDKRLVEKQIDTMHQVALDSSEDGWDGHKGYF